MRLLFKIKIYKFVLYVLCGVAVFPGSSVASEKNFFSKQLTSDTLQPDLPAGVVKITRTWELPAVLREVSAVQYLETGKLACLQDETGAIFIYNTSTNTIEREIPFGPPGDYEGLAIAGDDAYIACADGRLLQVASWLSESPAVTEYGTHLTVKQNVEGLCYDPSGKRLLAVIKGIEEGNQYSKGIYSFDLVSKKLLVKPVFEIDLHDPVFGPNGTRKPQFVFQPSDIAIAPDSGRLYITDAERQQLMVMSKTGRIEQLYSLTDVNIQPEGVCFSPSGELFIASVGNKQDSGKILVVKITE